MTFERPSTDVPMSKIGHVKHSRLTIRAAVRNALAAMRKQQGGAS